MKRVAYIFSVGILGMIFMSSYCTSPEQTASAKKELKAEIPQIKAGDGIDFKNISLEQAKKMASETGKLIFIDAFTSWCGPCKQMAATSFKDAEVGKVFNDGFINIKIEMEKDKEGPEVARTYNVRAYPTLLVIDGDGNLVKQVIGFQTKDRLLSLAEAVL